MVDFDIRQADEGHVEGLASIWLEGQLAALGSAPAQVSEEHLVYFRSRIRGQTEVFQVWVAVQADGQVLGWQALAPMRNHPVLRSKNAESSTYVAAAARGRGVGLALIRHACQHAATSGLAQVFGFMADGNVAMRRIIEGEGFVRVGSLPPPPRLPDSPPMSFWVYDVPA